MVLSIIAWGLVTLVSTFAGSYLGGYLRKKGENLATHEDVDRLVEQVRAVTAATKEIEAKIASDVWDRQKRWELRREVLLRVTKSLSETDDALVEFATALKLFVQYPTGTWAKRGGESAEKWNRAAKDLGEAKHLVAIVCGPETKKAVDDFVAFSAAIALGTSKENAQIFQECRSDLSAKTVAVRAAMRKELAIDKEG